MTVTWDGREPLRDERTAVRGRAGRVLWTTSRGIWGEMEVFRGFAKYKVV